jgi:hypothetical protein
VRLQPEILWEFSLPEMQLKGEYFRIENVAEELSGEKYVFRVSLASVVRR